MDVGIQVSDEAQPEPSPQQRMNDCEEEDIDQLLAGANDPVPPRARLGRLKRVAAITTTPPSKRMQLESPDASLASPPEEAAPGQEGTADEGEEHDEHGSALKGLPDDSKGSHKSAEGDDSAAKEDYWDEEDELEEYIMKRDLGQIKEGDGSDSSSSSKEGGSGGKAADASDTESEEGPLDVRELNAETQRILRDTAKNDRIGRGAVPQIQPFSGVLEKIMKRKEAAISRAAKVREKLPLKTPPSTKQLQSRKKPFTPLPDIAEDDGDLVLVDSDEDEAARKATLFTEDQLQLFGADSQSQLVAPTAPVVGQRPSGLSAKMPPRKGLLSFMKHGPMEDTQNMIGSELPLYAERLTTCDDAGEPAGDSSTEGPRLDIRLGSDTEADAGEALLPDSAADSCQEEYMAAEEPADVDVAMQAEEAGQECGSEAENEDEGGGEVAAGSGSDSEGDADDEDEGDEDEESVLSSDSDDESEEEEEEQKQPPGAAALQRALEEARALLGDQPKSKKNKSAFFEDEAEESEDGAGSKGDDEDDDDADEDGVLEDLIGAEQEGRHDEKRRAALHAAWLEQQDNAQVEQLLHGVKNGLRRRRNALDDEGGTNYEAAMRRAALMNTDDEAEESGSGDESDDEDARSEEADPFEDIDALSDEEAKEELRQAQQLKMLEDSQKEEAKALTLLDDDSRAVLGLLQRAGAASTTTLAAKPTAGQLPRPNFAHDLTNRPVKASFLGRKSSNPVSLLSKSSSQMGNTRSFIFGSENSNSANVNNQEAPPQAAMEDAQKAAPAGPTSFAGLHVATAAVLGKGGRAHKEGCSNLLGMLHKTAVREMRKAAADASTAQAEHAVMDVRSILTDKKKASRR